MASLPASPDPGSVAPGSAAPGPVATAEPPADAELLRRWSRHGDQAALVALIRRHERLVFSTARRVLGSASEAEEVAQDAFLLLARKAAHLPPAATVPGWLHRTATFLALKRRRAMHRRLHRETLASRDEAVLSAPEQPAAAWAEQVPRLDAALDRLPARLRAAIVLHHLQGIPSAEAARRLGCSPAALAKRLARGLERLRRALVPRGAAPLSAAALATWLGEERAHAALAPVDFAARVTAAATAAGGAALGPLAWLSAHRLLAAAAVALLTAVGSVGGFFLYRQHLRDELVRVVQAAAKAPPPAPSPELIPGAAAEVTTATQPAARRFATSGEFSRWVRRVIHASSREETRALLRDAGIELGDKRFAAAHAQMESLKSRLPGVEVDNNTDSVFFPYIAEWLRADAEAASRWVLREWPNPHDWVISDLAERLHLSPRSADLLLREFATHPKTFWLQACLLSRSDPRSALGLVIKHPSSFNRFQTADIAEQGLKAWARQDLDGLLAWGRSPENARWSGAVFDTVAGALMEGADGGRVNLTTLEALVTALPAAAQATAKGRLGAIRAAQAYHAGDYAAALDQWTKNPKDRDRFDRGLENAALRRWLGKDPTAAAAFVGAHAAGADLARPLAELWAARDFEAAAAWAVAAPPALREPALTGLANQLATEDPAAALRFAADTGLGPQTGVPARLFVAWLDRDTHAASAWLAASASDALRRPLTLAAIDHLAYKQPERALELAATTPGALTPARTFALAKALASRAPEATAALAAAVADDPALAFEARVGAEVENWRADPAQTRARLVRALGPERADLAELRICTGDSNAMSDQPAAVATLLDRLVARPDFASAPHRAQVVQSVSRVVRYWTMNDPDAALRWAARLPTPELRADARRSIENVLAQPSAEQRAALDALAPAR